MSEAMSEEVTGMGEVPRMDGYGNVHFNGSTRIVLWMLGIFGAVMTILLSLVLQAVYTTNGAVNELKGQQVSGQQEMTEMRQEMAAFQQEMMALARSEHHAS